MKIELTENELKLIDYLCRQAKCRAVADPVTGITHLRSKVRAAWANEPDTTEQRGPDRKPIIVVEPGALNHIRCMDLIDFMIPQGLEMVQDGTRLVIRRKHGDGGKVQGNAGEFSAFNVAAGGAGGNPPANSEGGSGGRAGLQSRLDETYSTKQAQDEAWEKAKDEVEQELKDEKGSE